jgi:hypothetical protein
VEFSLIPDILASVTNISDVIELFRNHGDYIAAWGSTIPNVFRSFGIGPDKVKEPPPVDYASAARETAAGNLQYAKQTAADNLALAEATTKANRINQYTPYGSLEYTYGKQFDENAYNKALENYNNQKQARDVFNSKVASGEYRRVTGGKFGGSKYVDQQGNLINFNPTIMPPMPIKENFERGEPMWSQTMKLTPEAQATLDKQMAMDRQYADIAQSGLSKAQKTLENPELDFSKLPELQGIDLSALPQAPVNAGMTSQQAIMSRLQPTLKQSENELEQRLANQGITLGSEAYNREMQLAGQRRNDLELQAAREGITLDQAARLNALNEQNLRYGNLADLRGRLLSEQTMAKDRPLNLINALRSGAQVQNPTFQPYAMQGGVTQANTTGPNFVQAGQLGYQQGLDAYNAQQARQQQAVATAGKLIGSMFGGGGVAGGGGGMPQFIRGMFG